MAEKKKNSVPAAEQTKSVEGTEVKKEKTYTKKELDQIVEEAIRKCTEKTQSCGTVLQVVPDENVTLMFFGVIAPGTVVDLKKMGQFNRPGVALKVKKSEFFQNNTLLISTLLQERKIVVLDGLTDEERERYQLKYEDGEILTQKEFFDILKYSCMDLLKIFEKLCPSHRAIVVDLYAEDLFEQKGSHTTAEKVKGMKKLSRKGSPELLPLLEMMLEFLGKKSMEED